MNTILQKSRMIKAVRIHAFGGPEALCFEDVLAPEPGSGEVLVRVHAAGVNPLDWKVREGQFESLPLPRTLGTDFSGVVEDLGPGVTEFYVGQPVFGFCGFGGAFAQMIVVPIANLAPKPPSVEDVQAAATPLAALTAWQALFENACLRSGQKILIHGGAGGVGMFAVQLALRHGAFVIATGTGRSLSFLGRLGTQQLIDHNAVRFEDVVEGVDVVLDLIGGETQARSWQVLKTGGRLVSTVSSPGGDKALVSGARAMKVQTQMSADQLEWIGDLIANGEINVMVERVLPLYRAPEALEWSRAGHVHGKIVLTMDNSDFCPTEFPEAASEKFLPQSILSV
jgi:NADPH:quinone reductase-like Zn-dependent oxidoreductase